MESKKWYQSKTVWTNVLAVIVAIGFYFGVEPNPSTVQKVGEFLTVVVPVLNLALRLVTKQAIE